MQSGHGHLFHHHSHHSHHFHLPNHAEVQANLLTTAIRRLEAATSRLEDIASSSFEGGVAPSAAAGSIAGSATSQAIAAKPVEQLPPSIQDYDAILNNELKNWLDLSSKLGNVIDGQVKYRMSLVTAYFI
jgi:adenylyl cyclase-associated protein